LTGTVEVDEVAGKSVTTGVGMTVVEVTGAGAGIGVVVTVTGAGTGVGVEVTGAGAGAEVDVVDGMLPRLLQKLNATTCQLAIIVPAAYP